MASSGDGDHLEGRPQLERLTFFSDAVFAIAMTLLVIDVRVPELPHVGDRALAQALADLIPNYIGFLVSFVVIGRFWVAHHELFGMLRGSDARLMRRNLALLLAVAFMPFPTAVLSHYSELSVGVCFYGAWLAVLGLLNLIVTATALRGPLMAGNVDEQVVRRRRRGAWEPVLIGGIAFAAGWFSPRAGLAALVFASPLVGVAVHRWAARRGRS